MRKGCTLIVAVQPHACYLDLEDFAIFIMYISTETCQIPSMLLYILK